MSQVLTPRPCCPLAITGPLAFSVYAAVHIQALSRAIWQASFGDSALQKYQEWHSQGPGGHGDTSATELLVQARPGTDASVQDKPQQGLQHCVPHVREETTFWNLGSSFIEEAPDPSLLLLLFAP